MERSGLFINSKPGTFLFQYYSVFFMTLPFDGFPSGLASEYFWSKMKKLLFPILRSKVVSTLRRLRDLPESDQNCSCKEEHMLMSSQRSHISPTERPLLHFTRTVMINLWIVGNLVDLTFLKVENLETFLKMLYLKV